MLLLRRVSYSYSSSFSLHQNHHYFSLLLDSSPLEYCQILKVWKTTLTHYFFVSVVVLCFCTFYTQDTRLIKKGERALFFFVFFFCCCPSFFSSDFDGEDPKHYYLISIEEHTCTLLLLVLIDSTPATRDKKKSKIEHEKRPHISIRVRSSPHIKSEF